MHNYNIVCSQFLAQRVNFDAKSVFFPAQHEKVPARSMKFPAQSEDVPAKRENMPAKSEKLYANSWDLYANSYDGDTLSGDWYVPSIKKEAFNGEDGDQNIGQGVPKTKRNVLHVEMDAGDIKNEARKRNGFNLRRNTRVRPCEHTVPVEIGGIHFILDPNTLRKKEIEKPVREKRQPIYYYGQTTNYPSLRSHLTPPAVDPRYARMTTYGIPLCVKATDGTKTHAHAND